MTNNTFSGKCHCDNVSVIFSTKLAIHELVPRACDCDFCVQHGASWLSDPAGSLKVVINESHRLRHKQQGSNTANFAYCETCGVLVFASHQQNSVRYAALNSRCLDHREYLPEPAPVSPKTLSKEDKVSRWLQYWSPCSITINE